MDWRKIKGREREREDRMKIEEKMLECQAVLKVTLLNAIVYHKVEQMLNNTNMRWLHPECISWKIQSAVIKKKKKGCLPWVFPEYDLHDIM